MKGFFAGLLVAALAFAGYVLWKQRQPVTHTPSLSTADAGVVAKGGRERKRRRRSAQWVHAAAPGSVGSGRGEGAPSQLDPEPEPVKLSAADLKPTAQGDDLSRPDVLKLDLASDSTARELTQDDIDDRFRARQDEISSCISHARPDEETYVPGRVTVKFRIQRAGTIRGVRVEAPAILMKHGLYGCVKGVLGGIRFPASTSSQTLSYPFSLS
jgi:hypothetical protein